MSVFQANFSYPAGLHRPCELVYLTAMYGLARRVLFQLDPERAHTVALALLRSFAPLGIERLFCPPIAADPVKVMGLTFPNRVGLAAGFDKDGDYIDLLGGMGFGFLELGTATPRPQPGNPKPRLFRLPSAHALINRMGFNNKGIDHLVEQVKRSKYKGIIGINIGKNKDTPQERAAEDYLYCLERAYEAADYIAINVSSPNTPGLRKLQAADELNALLAVLKEKNEKLKQRHQKTVPLAVKIAPDLSDEEILNVVSVVETNAIEALIATNTTVERDAVTGLKHGGEAGGLSGAPLSPRSTEVVQLIRSAAKKSTAIIGVGGIIKAQDAQQKFAAGADLVQLYTGFVYSGPGLIAEIASIPPANQSIYEKNVLYPEK